MKIPRDISGSSLAKLLSRYGYEVTRQTGSHLRLTSLTGGEHHITIPDHSELRIGTLSAILSDVASHIGKDKSQIILELWG